MRPIVHQMPADFREHMHETYDDLMGRYEVSENTIRRWIAETGVKRNNRVQQKGCGNAPPGFAFASKHMDLTSLCTRYSVSADVIRRWKRETGVPLRNDRVVATSTFERAHVDTSVLLRAVTHLQKERAVSRRNADGLHDLSGRYWLCGRELLDEVGVIALAKRRGFDAEAWKRVAA